MLGTDPNSAQASMLGTDRNSDPNSAVTYQTIEVE
jgi:hypothetical protein